MTLLDDSLFDPLQKETEYTADYVRLPFGLISEVDLTNPNRQLLEGRVNSVASALSVFELPGSKYAIEIRVSRYDDEERVSSSRFAGQEYKVLGNSSIRRTFSLRRGYIANIPLTNIPEYTKGVELSNLLVKDVPNLISQAMKVIEKDEVTNVRSVTGSIVATTAEHVGMSIGFSQYNSSRLEFFAPRYFVEGSKLFGIGPRLPITKHQFTLFSSMMKQSLRNLLFEEN